MHRSARVAALELPHRHGEPEAALARVDRALAALAPDVDLALLPECALTGYLSPTGDFDLAPFAEPLGGPTTEALAALARGHRVALAGPLVERGAAGLYNALLLFAPDGTLAGHWRKRHPWHPERWASPGDLGTPVVECAGLRVTACICFDVHFIGEDAPEALASADALLYPSAWVDEGPRDDARAELLPALARRFGLPVVNANWGPGEPRVWGQGRSRVVLADGAEVRAAGRGEPVAALATLRSR